MYDVSAGQAAFGETDPDRLHLLYVIYNGRLLRHLRAQLGTRWELAEDLAQDTWERVAKSLHTCRAADDQAFTWIRTVARTAIAADFRRAGAKRSMPGEFAVYSVPAPFPAVPAAEDVPLADVIALPVFGEHATPLGAVA